MRQEYFGFAVNEYHYKRVHFTRHFSIEAAERAHYRPFSIGQDPVSADLAPTVIAGREAFEKWARECRYKIDWKFRILVYEEVTK